ncbi:thermonuclease family protein [Halobacillus karajensis]|uniref:thermonuclease family protein n=1 Tax=Halobacillus karajensis TaxID=195088 RepID=UPI00045D40FF|nr:thermonuclease family protein [Halobacillus karajensis]CDQ21716.1 hypothetical protein BN982_04125 [Halobacillus karajensis]
MKRTYQYHVQVKRVIDGDTFVGDIDLGMNVKLCDVHFRLIGVDTPERGQNLFYEATERASELIDQTEVLVETYAEDAFGRWLVNVYIDYEGDTLNQLLLDEGLAIVYD